MNYPRFRRLLQHRERRSRWRIAGVVRSVSPAKRMKNRLLWALILSVGITALYCGIFRPHVSSIPKEVRDPMADLRPPAPPPIEPPPLVIPDMPTLTPPLLNPVSRTDPILGRPEVPIQNQATIDFSTGAPVVKRGGKDQDALDAALREISDVIKDAKIERKSP